MPTSFVAAEKVLFAMLRAFAATLLMIPIGYLVLGHIPWIWANVCWFVAALILGSLVGLMSVGVRGFYRRAID